MSSSDVTWALACSHLDYKLKNYIYKSEGGGVSPLMHLFSLNKGNMGRKGLSAMIRGKVKKKGQRCLQIFSLTKCNLI